MPWRYPNNVPAVARNWTADEQRRCVAAANSVLREGGEDAEARAIYACIHAAGRQKASAEEDKSMLEYKAVPFELTKVDEGGRTFEGYASMFRDPLKDDPDHTGDMVVKGAFKRTIAERGHKVKMLWQHDPGQPIGRFTELREDDRGLFVKGMVSDTRLGRDALTLLKDHAIDSMSIGYDVASNGADWAKTKSGASIRLLKEVRLWEVSLVTFPADEAAKVTALKEQPAEPEPEPVPAPIILRARTQAKTRLDTALDGAVDDALAALEAARLLSDALKGTEDKAGRRLSSATVAKLQAAMQALKELMGMPDDEDEEDMPHKPKSVNPENPETPPAEAETQPGEAGADSTPAEQKAGDAAPPPSTAAAVEEPEPAPPTSSAGASDAVEAKASAADPFAELDAAERRVAAILTRIAGGNDDHGSTSS